MHYAAYRRESFAKWIDDDCPAVAVMGTGTDVRQVSAQVMLRRMRRCSDVLPSALVEILGDRLGRGNGLSGRTYGEAARRLLDAEVTATP
jgi:hypothetical protein